MDTLQCGMLMPMGVARLMEKIERGTAGRQQQC